MGLLSNWFSSRDGITDEQAMWRVQQQGDHAAFGELLRRWEQPIRRLCIRMTGDEQRGEDLTQETFARVYAHRASFLPGRKFSAWLWRIALNLCHDEARRVQRRGESPLEDDEGAPAVPHDLAPGPDERLMERERADLVRAALQSLPEEQRAVLVLREYEGLKLREIAELLEVPEGTVKSRLGEGLTRLGQRLRPALRDESTLPRVRPRPLERKTMP